jgi:ABC-type lipoprotein export system ATPase subunit
MSMALLSTRKLTKSVAQGPSRVWLLRDIDLDIETGDFVSISGPSGAGKSTLLHILGMHDAEWEGSYALDGHDIRALSPKQRADLQRRTIGFVFQSYHLIDDLTVAENLDVPLRYRDIPKSERQSLVADSLDRFRMVGKKDLYPSQLSGGQQQLVGIARAVIASPKLILADEPTGNLHSEQAREIMELFRELNRGGTTIVQVTHSEENAAYGNRLVRLRDGWLSP